MENPPFWWYLRVKMRIFMGELLVYWRVCKIQPSKKWGNLHPLQMSLSVCCFCDICDSWRWRSWDRTMDTMDTMTRVNEVSGKRNQHDEELQKTMQQAYPPGNEHIPPGEKEHHLQICLIRGYVSFGEGNWLVVEPTHLKNISQNGNLPQIGMHIKNVWNHHLDKDKEVWHQNKRTSHPSWFDLYLSAPSIFYIVNYAFQKSDKCE